eukprot:snap_masked-scaffold_70-processed-gene-0.58-mRNA-1 protein AED:1.00 eAED:1.00 QI:0/-1/0/0/-1/1/1/0/61
MNFAIFCVVEVYAYRKLFNSGEDKGAGKKEKIHHLDERDQCGIKGVGGEAERVVHGNIKIF